MRRSDEKYFAPFLSRHPEVKVWNAATRKVPLQQMNGLLLTGGADIAPEYLNQPVPDPSVIEKDVHPARDRWELDAVKHAIGRGIPIFAICKGLQTFNVALGGAPVGQKTCEGDNRTPEGTYTLDHVNRASRYHLAFQFLMEGLVLSALGGMAGVTLGVYSLGPLLRQDLSRFLAAGMRSTAPPH